VQQIISGERRAREKRDHPFPMRGKLLRKPRWRVHFNSMESYTDCVWGFRFVDRIYQTPPPAPFSRGDERG